MIPHHPHRCINARKKNWYGLIFSLFLTVACCQPVMAGFETESHAGSAGGIASGRYFFEDPTTFDIRGFVRGEVHVPAHSRDDGVVTFGSSDTYLMVTADLKLDAFLSDAAAAFVNLRYRAGDNARGPDTAGYVGDHADRRFDVREACLQWRGAWLDITAGQQIIS
ncbi:MAG: hypothetical protein CR984_06905, partial [Proteobacteria bacterium]